MSEECGRQLAHYNKFLESPANVMGPGREQAGLSDWVYPLFSEGKWLQGLKVLGLMGRPHLADVGYPVPNSVQLMALTDNEGSLSERRGPRRALSLLGLRLCHLGLVTW